MAPLSRAGSEALHYRVGIPSNAISHATVSAIVGGSGLTDSCVRHRKDKDGNEKTCYELRTESLMKVHILVSWCELTGESGSAHLAKPLPSSVLWVQILVTARAE